MTGSKAVTLIELLVGIACFSIVVALVTGIFVTALSAKKQAKELSVLQDEARYIMDYMSREIRTAEIIKIETNELEIMNAVNENIVYGFANNNIERKIKGQAGEELNTVDVIVGTFSGNISPNGLVTIYIKLQKDNNFLEIQTTISSRSY